MNSTRFLGWIYTRQIDPLTTADDELDHLDHDLPVDDLDHDLSVHDLPKVCKVFMRESNALSSSRPHRHLFVLVVRCLTQTCCTLGDDLAPSGQNLEYNTTTCEQLTALLDVDAGVCLTPSALGYNDVNI